MPQRFSADIPIVQEIIRILRQHPEGLAVPEIRNNLLRGFKQCIKAAGIPSHGVDIHCLRYTFGAHLVRHGANIKTAQRLMRHKTASMTLDVYAQYFADDGQSAIDSLPFNIGTETIRPKPPVANDSAA